MINSINSFYGKVMSSPISVVIANLVMEHVEVKALASFCHEIHFQKLYIDIVCYYLSKDYITL